MSKTYFPSRTTRSKQFWNSLSRGLFLTLFTDLLTDLLQPGASVSSKSNRVKDRHELAWESLTQGEQRSWLLWRAVQQGESQVDGPEECPEAKCKSSRTSKEKKKKTKKTGKVKFQKTHPHSENVHGLSYRRLHRTVRALFRRREETSEGNASVGHNCHRQVKLKASFYFRFILFCIFQISNDKPSYVFSSKLKGTPGPLGPAQIIPTSTHRGPAPS